LSEDILIGLFFQKKIRPDSRNGCRKVGITYVSRDHVRRVHRAISPDNVACDYGNFIAGSHLAAIAGYF